MEIWLRKITLPTTVPSQFQACNGCLTMDPVSVATAMNVSAQVNNIPMLNGTNFKAWKEAVEIVLRCMNMDLALRSKRPPSNSANIDKWDRSNQMCLMIMKRSIPEAFRGSITEGKDANKFLEEIQPYFANNEKSEVKTIMAKLISMRYKGNDTIRKYIMKMSRLASKLKSSKLELSNDLLVNLILFSLPEHFGKLKVSYNTQKDKWSLNELIHLCIQEEEKTGSQIRKSKRIKGNVEGTSQPKKQRIEDFAGVMHVPLDIHMG